MAFTGIGQNVHYFQSATRYVNESSKKECCEAVSLTRNESDQMNTYEKQDMESFEQAMRKVRDDIIEECAQEAEKCGQKMLLGNMRTGAFNAAGAIRRLKTTAAKLNPV